MTTMQNKNHLSCALCLLAVLTLTLAVPAQLIGSYTIDNTQPTAGTNYNTFVAAAAALASGVSGPVTFTVATGSGPYGGFQLTGPITGASSTNTITFAAGIGQTPVLNAPHT